MGERTSSSAWRTTPGSSDRCSATSAPRLAALSVLLGAAATALPAAVPAAHAVPLTEQAVEWTEPAGGAVPSERDQLDGNQLDGDLLDACPVDGPSTFEDSWGWPRSGGRSHQGVDMIAARGTPVIAVRDGQAQFTENQLGGRAIWITADNGDRFYYAHLNSWEGQSRDVLAGDVIGYVGSTGNAGAPHLHFETHPGGHVENPFAHTVGACVPTPEELAATNDDAETPLATRLLR